MKRIVSGWWMVHRTAAVLALVLAFLMGAVWGFVAGLNVIVH